MSVSAKDIMSTELLTVSPSDTVEHVIRLFINHRITGVPVVDELGHMIGVCSEYDLIKQIAKNEEVNPKVFRKRIHFTKKVKAIHGDVLLDDLIHEFVARQFRRLPVVDSEGKLVGIITRRDLMRVFYYQSKLAD